ncbi:hypothetical protein VTJ04DRAFT_3451 [Mycothermus thermophilus]|uniref:uncharacterized protein n=1 Tax=Humicola insolens TaxID=85995 RepID=UPI003742A3EA
MYTPTTTKAPWHSSAPDFICVSGTHFLTGDIIHPCICSPVVFWSHLSSSRCSLLVRAVKLRTHSRWDIAPFSPVSDHPSYPTNSAPSSRH